MPLCKMMLKFLPILVPNKSNLRLAVQLILVNQSSLASHLRKFSVLMQDVVG